MSSKSNGQSSKRKKAIDVPFDAAVMKRAEQMAPQYRIMIHREPEFDGYGGTVVEMPNVVGFGQTIESCFAETQALLVTMLAYMYESGEEPPAPMNEVKRTEQINVRLTSQEKFEIEQATRQHGFRGVSDFVRNASLAAAQPAKRSPRRKTKK